MGGKFALATLSVVLLVTAVQAQVLYSDGFESYSSASTPPLDKNTAGPNSAPNGSGNPWFGPAPPNLRVVTAETSVDGVAVTPHSGTQMVRGSNLAGDGDQNWYNLAYRLNGGNKYTGNIYMQWWFFDPLGSGGTNYQDYAALGFYNTAPSNTDYPGTGSLNGSTQVQRLSLGASNPAGFDNTKYQVRVPGATDSGALPNGWYNTSVSRTIGWHEGEIDVGPALGDNTNTVTFIIDGTTVLTHNSIGALGYNVMELNDNFGPATTNAYYDDLSFGTLTTVPEPSSFLLVAGSLAVAWRRLRRTN